MNHGNETPPAAANGRHHARFGGIPSYVRPAGPLHESHTQTEPEPQPGAVAMGWLPELHCLQAKRGEFTLLHADGRARTFINLALREDLIAAIVVFYDPAHSDECQVFDARLPMISSLAKLDQRAYRGAGLLLCDRSSNGIRHQVFLYPEELRHEWLAAASAPHCVTCYFQDAQGRLALGYRDEPKGRDPEYHVLSGPRDFHPMLWHRAHTVNLVADVKGGVA
jgi:hypothetical protein